MALLRRWWCCHGIVQPTSPDRESQPGDRFNKILQTLTQARIKDSYCVSFAPFSSFLTSIGPTGNDKTTRTFRISYLKCIWTFIFPFVPKSLGWMRTCKAWQLARLMIRNWASFANVCKSFEIPFLVTECRFFRDKSWTSLRPVNPVISSNQFETSRIKKIALAAL